jgi:hypothetical protein
MFAENLGSKEQILKKLWLKIEIQMIFFSSYPDNPGKLVLEHEALFGRDCARCTRNFQSLIMQQSSLYSLNSQ